MLTNSEVEELKSIAHYSTTEKEWIYPRDMTNRYMMETLETMLKGTKKKDSLFEDENFQGLIFNLADRIKMFH